MILSREQARHIAGQLADNVAFFDNTFSSVEWGLAFMRPEGTTVSIDWEIGVIYIEEWHMHNNVQVSVNSERYDSLADFVSAYKL